MYLDTSCNQGLLQYSVGGSDTLLPIHVLLHDLGYIPCQVHHLFPGFWTRYTLLHSSEDQLGEVAPHEGKEPLDLAWRVIAGVPPRAWGLAQPALFGILIHVAALHTL